MTSYRYHTEALGDGTMTSHRDDTVTRDVTMMSDRGHTQVQVDDTMSSHRNHAQYLGYYSGLPQRPHSQSYYRLTQWSPTETTHSQ
jgi:hypothetical protein